MIHDVPNIISNKIKLSQYANEIAIWLNVSFREKETLFENQICPKINRTTSFVCKSEFVLASQNKQKTEDTKFNNGHGLRISCNYFESQELKYSCKVKLLGFILTTKLHCGRKMTPQLKHKISLFKYIA